MTKETIKDPYEGIDPSVPASKKKPDLSQKGRENEDNAQKTISKYWLRFIKAESALQTRHKKWAEIDKFDRGEQWKDASIPPWVPKPVTNYIRYVRTLKRANLASAISRPQFTPLHIDDVDMIRQLQLAHDHVWDTHRVDRIVRRSIDRALLQGTSIAYVYMDDSFFGGKYYGSADPDDPNYNEAVKNGDKKNQLFQGDIKIKRWPNANFFPDPDAYCLEDCKWIDTTEIVSLRNVKNNPAFLKYCEDQGTADKLLAVNYNQLEYDDDASGTIYEREVTPLNTTKGIIGDEIITLHTHWERYYKNGAWKLDVTYWLRNTDFFLLRLEDVKPSEYPFAVLYDEEEENDFWGTATVMDIMENQKIINKLQQTASILGVLHQNPQKVVLRESGINAQELARTGTLSGKVWQSNVPADQAISIIKPMDIPKGLFDLDDRTQSAIKDMVGTNEAYTGQSTGSLTTSTGVSDLIERATIRDKDKMVQIDEFVERISHLIICHILYKWKDPRPVSRMGQNGQPQFGTWQPVDTMTADNITWRIRSDLYAKAPTTQASRRQQADKLLQMQGQFQYQPAVITPMEYIRRYEFQDQEEILQRMEQDQQQLDQQKAQDLAQQITQVAQQIDQAKKQGASDQQVQQMALQVAQQLTQQTQAQDNKNGMSNGSQPQAESQAPQGVTSQVAMSNMTQGS